MGIFLGLLAAVTYGTSDFAGGLVSRRANPITVVVFSQSTGLLLLLAVLPFTWGDGPLGTQVGWGAVAGLAGATGVVLLYRGLSIGRMSVVAPITALLAATVPVLVGFVRGDLPSPTVTVGVILALMAIGLVSSDATHPTEEELRVEGSWLRRPGLIEAVGAGMGFGLFFVLLAQSDQGAAIWTLLASKAMSVTLMFTIAGMRGAPLRPPPGTWRLMVFAGLLDTSANGAFLLSSREALLSVAAVLTSLYPATTILCARIFLKERLARVQQIGLVLAAAGVVLITLG